MFDEGASFGQRDGRVLSGADGFDDPPGAAYVVVSASSIGLDENVSSIVAEVLLVVSVVFVGV